MTRQKIHTYIYTAALVLFPCFLFAQSPAWRQLEDDFSKYRSLSLPEKIFAHTDKTFYLAGETLWFKIYDVDGEWHKPFNLSSVAYVELMDKDQRPVLQTSTGLSNGKGSGSLQLATSIPSGNYLLRCYTAWMKNFDPDLFFRQQITIVNTFKDAAPAPTEGPALSIRFFPEGGNLVYGLQSKVAFQLLSRDGQTDNIRAYILDQGKDTVVRFRPGKMGTGSFLFTPLTGHSYNALISAGDSVFTEKLPAIYDNGYVMHLSNASDDRLKITLQTSPAPSIPFAYLFVYTRRQMHSVQLASFSTGNEAVFYIDKQTLDEGISRFTVFDGQKAPVCERLYFKPVKNIMTIDARLSRPDYATRQKVQLQLATTIQNGQPVNADLSLSAFLTDSLQGTPKEDIVSYLLLSSELKGTIPSPRYCLQDTTMESRETLDNLLLIHGWSRFHWEEVLQHKKTYFEFLPETNGSIITGKLVDRRTGQSGPPTIGYLSIPGSSFVFSVSRSRPDGSIRFNTRNFFNSRDIIVQTNSQTADSNYRIDIINPFSDKPGSFNMPPFSVSPALASQLLSRSISMQAYNTYLPGEKRRFLPGFGEDTISFYGHSDHVYFLDDYTRFQTLEEVMREYVEEMRVRQQSGKINFRVKNSLFNLFFEDDPLVLIDGVPAFDMNKMLSTDPLKIKKIEMITRKFHTGPLINDGIISYKTYNGDLGGYQLDPNAISFHYDGLQLQREFYAPAYDNGNAPPARIPDLRNVLQWTPDIDTGPQGKTSCSFVTSDLPGTYLLFIQGITAQGQPGSRIISFTVHK